MSIDPWQQEYGIVHARYLPFEGLMTIQPLTEEDDRLFVFNWVKLEFIKGLWPVEPVSPRILSDMFVEELESDYAQPLLGKLDGESLFLLEVSCEFLSGENEVALFLPDDYVMRLLIRQEHQHSRELCFFIIRFCTEFIFSFNEVKRLFIKIDMRIHPLTELFKQAGFRFEQSIRQNGEILSLLVCGRDSH